VHIRFRAMMVRLIERELPTGDGALPRTSRARCLAALLTELMGWWIDNGATDAKDLVARCNLLVGAICSAK
jgi:hypothetical protein